MLVACDGVQPSRVVLHPVELDVLAFELGEQLAGENVVILVILDEQNSEWLYWMHGLH